MTRFWIGVLHKAEEAYTQEPPLPSEQLGILWKQHMVDFPSLAVTQATLQGQEPRDGSATHIQNLLERSPYNYPAVSHLSTILPQKTITSRQKKLATGEKPQGLSLTPGGTVMVRPGWYLHWCMHCLEPFRSKTPDPEQCGRRGCRKKGWRTGVDYKPKTRISSLKKANVL